MLSLEPFLCYPRAGALSLLSVVFWELVSALPCVSTHSECASIMSSKVCLVLSRHWESLGELRKMMTRGGEGRFFPARQVISALLPPPPPSKLTASGSFPTMIGIFLPPPEVSLFIVHSSLLLCLVK